MTVIATYLLFAGEDYYPRGGVHDLIKVMILRDDSSPHVPSGFDAALTQVDARIYAIEALDGAIPELSEPRKYVKVDHHFTWWHIVELRPGYHPRLLAEGRRTGWGPDRRDAEARAAWLAKPVEERIADTWERTLHDPETTEAWAWRDE